MSEKKPIVSKTTTATQPVSKTPSHGVKSTDALFTKDNYVWMIAGIVVIALGMLLMAGGKSENPAVFDQKEVYSTTRITIAPLVIVIGLALEIVAIFKKPKSAA